MTLTSAAFHLRVELLKDQHFIVSHFIEVVPIMSGTVVYFCILRDSVKGHHVLAHQVHVVIHGTPVAERQRPVISRPLERLPKTGKEISVSAGTYIMSDVVVLT